MITRINAKAEKALREALHSVTHLEKDQIPPSLAALDGQERAEAGALAIMITGYVLVNACGAQWPVQSSVQRIARTLATKTTTAERLGLDPDEIYAYLWRTVFGPESLEDVIPDEPAFTRFPVVVAGEALAVYTPKGVDMWDFLDQVELGIEEASALEARVLPGAVMRAYMTKPE